MRNHFLLYPNIKKIGRYTFQMSLLQHANINYFWFQLKLVEVRRTFFFIYRTNTNKMITNNVQCYLSRFNCFEKCSIRDWIMVETILFWWHSYFLILKWNFPEIEKTKGKSHLLLLCLQIGLSNAHWNRNKFPNSFRPIQQITSHKSFVILEAYYVILFWLLIK